jgi:hypothetical protein
VNTFVLTAPPFLPITCQVQWPESVVQGLCGIGSDTSLRARVGSAGPTYAAEVNLRFEGKDLPPQALANALDNIRGALQGMRLEATLPSGEYMATGLDMSGRIISQPVPQPTRATLLVAPTELDYGSDTLCAQSGCDQPGATAGNISAWAVAAAVSVQWQYVSLGSADATTLSPSYDAGPLRLVLSADAQGNWILDQQATQQATGISLPAALPMAACRAGALYLESVLSASNLGASVVVDHGLVGCAIKKSAAGTGATETGTFIWRFGVMLATDANALAIFPGVPLAPPSVLAAFGLAVPAG